jgi:hypothetical protein
MKTTKSTNESEASAPANVRPSASKNESLFGEAIYAYTRKQAEKGSPIRAKVNRQKSFRSQFFFF